jgi:flagellum-specific ATP synthase
MTLHEPLGLRVGDPVTSTAGLQFVPVGRQMLGAVLDGLGRPIGGRTEYAIEAHYPVFGEAPRPLSRRGIDEPLATGVRSIDALLTIGSGQRAGIFAGTGVGKSVLLGMMARYTRADVTVAALVGERGREVQDFLRRDLGPEGLARSVVVVSTSDESPVLRVRAAFAATAVAEYFRDQGAHVLLLIDSITRMAMAQRQIGLSAGEPPATKGYPPSVFSLLPRLLERAGRTADGSITGLYAVLVEGDDIAEPVSDAARSILDGHVWLSRRLANRAHYPAVSVLDSVSRVMGDVVDAAQLEAAATVRRVLAAWNDIEDLVNIGAYVRGANPDFDLAVATRPALDEFLQQRRDDPADFKASRERLLKLAEEIRRRRESLSTAAGPANARRSAPTGDR